MSIYDASIAVLLLIIVWSIYRTHNDPNSAFNLMDLIMENGRVSKLAFAFMTGLVLLSWVMIRLTLNEKMSEGYMGLYGATIIAPVIAKLFSPPLVPGTTTTTDSSKTVTTVQPLEIK